MNEPAAANAEGREAPIKALGSDKPAAEGHCCHGGGQRGAVEPPAGAGPNTYICPMLSLIHI